jgi:hypothetical protein
MHAFHEHTLLRHFVTMMTKHEVVQSPLSPISTLAQSYRFRFRAPRGPHPCWAFTVRGHVCVVLSNANVAPRERACVLSTNLRQRCDISSQDDHEVVPLSRSLVTTCGQPRLSTPRLTSAVTVDINECICACPPSLALHRRPQNGLANVGQLGLSVSRGNVIICASPTPESPDGHTV